MFHSQVNPLGAMTCNNMCAYVSLSTFTLLFAICWYQAVALGALDYQDPDDEILPYPAAAGEYILFYKILYITA